MVKTSRLLDPAVVDRSVSLFSRKAEVLDPAALETLAGDVLRHIAGRSQSRRKFERDPANEPRLAEFCAALLGPDHALPLRFLEARRAEGVSFDDLCLDYLGAAAVWMGSEWEQDRVSFLDTTVVVSRLYALMRSLRRSSGEVAETAGGQRRALFATVPGEDHGLGITLAADMFRAEGWEIDLRTGGDHDALVDVAERLQPPVIGLSFSSVGRLAALARLVVAQRLVAPDAIIAVAPPASMDDNALTAVVEIDLVIRDAVSARAALDRIDRFLP